MFSCTLSPFIGPFAHAVCDLLARFGGAILRSDGTVLAGVLYERREGTILPRLLHVLDIQSNTPYVFVLDEITGNYTTSGLQLWPLAPGSTCLPDVQQHLPIRPVAQIVEDFLSDILPTARPRSADPEHLRRQVQWLADDPQGWVDYWEKGAGQVRVRTGRFRPTVWVSRKKRRPDSRVSWIHRRPVEGHPTVKSQQEVDKRKDCPPPV